MGFEFMNEPHYGHIGMETIKKYDYNKFLHLGLMPTPLEGFALGEGHAQECRVYERSWPIPTKVMRKEWVNREGAKVWLGGTCLWRAHGVWELRTCRGGKKSKPHALKPDYFHKHPETGQPVHFYRDFYVPLANRYNEAIRKVYRTKQPHRTPLFFVEPIPNEEPIHLHSTAEALELGVGTDFVHAPHWYDLSMTFSKSFNGWLTHNVHELSKVGWVNVE